MELTNDLRVPLPVDQAWAVLTDLERIAPCLPGAQLQEVEGDVYRGVVKVKVGPVTAQYKGEARFLEQDEAARRAVLRAEGRETRGQGNASATITATLAPDGDGSALTLVTDLTITGKVAQFGRGVLADVSSNLLGQFGRNLEETVLADGGGAAGEPASAPEADAPTAGDPAVEAATSAAAAAGADAGAPTPTVRKIDAPEAEPVDLVGAAGSPVLKRVAGVVAVVAVALLVLRFLRRRRR